MPPGFSGLIEWNWIENRPFLRASHGVALYYYAALGRRAQAVEIMEKIMTWNPSDNQGIRFIIGNEYHRLGDTWKAARIFDKEADQYPPYQYELAQGEALRPLP